MEKIKVNDQLLEYEIALKDNSYKVIQNQTAETFQIFKYGYGYLVFDIENQKFCALDVYQSKDKTIIWVDDQELILEEELEENSTSEDEFTENNIKSPMPGIIKEIKFKENDIVKKGDTIVVLESMKVLNELKCGVDGLIKKIHVSVGSQIGPLEILVEIEPQEEK